MGAFTNDAQAGFKLEFGGPTALARHIMEATPQDFYDVGAFAQDPAGWAQLYYRPNPASTAGLYYIAPFSGGCQGFLLPFTPPVKVGVLMRQESTQEEATVIADAGAIIIVDREKFIRSLQKIVWPPRMLPEELGGKT
jgi:hypothetical protein